MTIFLLIVGLLLFVLLVVLHELGHFMVARRNGVKVEEFGLGFPPRAKILAKKKGTIYSLNWLPLGGFVRLYGEHDADNKPQSFGAANLWVKSKIMLAGVVVNFLIAIIIFSVVAAVGMPKLITNDRFGQDQFTIASDTKVIKDNAVIGDVEAGSPAAKAGIAIGDTVLDITPTGHTSTSGGNIAIQNATQLSATTKSLAGQQVRVTVKRQSQVKSFMLTLRNSQVVMASLHTSQRKGYLGVAPQDYIIQRSTWSAPIVAVGLSAQFTRLTFQGLWSAIRGLGSIIAGLITHNNTARQVGQSEASQVGGPISIFFVLKAGASQGFVFILFIIGLISLTLAIMNILPVPALDGGRLYLTLLSRKIFKKPLQTTTEEKIVGISFTILLLLVALITIADVKRFF